MPWATAQRLWVALLGALPAALGLGLLMMAGCSGPAGGTTVTEVQTVTMATPPTTIDVTGAFPSAGGLCTAAFEASPTGGTAETPVLILQYSPSGATDPWVHMVSGVSRQGSQYSVHPFVGLEGVTSTVPEMVNTLVCIMTSGESAGCYTASGYSAIGCANPCDPPALRPEWEVRLVRWPGGEVVAAVSLLGGDPPQQIAYPPDSLCPGLQVQGLGAPPVAQFVDWLLPHLGQ